MRAKQDRRKRRGKKEKTVPREMAGENVAFTKFNELNVCFLSYTPQRSFSYINCKTNTTKHTRDPPTKHTHTNTQ